MASPRTVNKTIYSVEQPEGKGARVRRSIGGRQLATLDPFLLLDHFKVKPPAGFPDHPHRGFETVTYMLDGSFTHEDFKRHKGTIHAGDLQWMTAGRGVLHCEMPGPEGGEGLQLWVNLAKKNKMVDAAYQELLKKDIPVVKKDGVTAVVIAGECLGVHAAVRTLTPTLYLDITLDPGSHLTQPVPPGWNVFGYVWSGKAMFGPLEKQTEGPEHNTVTFDKEGDSVRMENISGSPARIILIGGQPLNEPIARHGPFVMNTQEEINQAFHDYSEGVNGFEHAGEWKSDHVRKLEKKMFK
ncbi:Pirin-like protein [Hypsibius exemplaris]|uniref:Pirin n=1 Tax=Hypsibius exemplaris TaxID=2072580 RepID=A0A1W0WRV0_HYPEX|nr:Pirin-like protein [Hypsibius exemplaris]